VTQVLPWSRLTTQEAWCQLPCSVLSQYCIDAGPLPIDVPEPGERIAWRLEWSCAPSTREPYEVRLVSPKTLLMPVVAVTLTHVSVPLIRRPPQREVPPPLESRLVHQRLAKNVVLQHLHEIRYGDAFRDDHASRRTTTGLAITTRLFSSSSSARPCSRSELRPPSPASLHEPAARIARRQWAHNPPMHSRGFVPAQPFRVAPESPATVQPATVQLLLRY
jgi:hypothetical protein